MLVVIIEVSNESFKMIAMDVFSGCGGLSLGLKAAGFRVVAAIELETKAVDTYRTNHPDVAVFAGDIRELSASTVALHARDFRDSARGTNHQPCLTLAMR
jgi:site-specific DNA-cytosine methylase